MRVQTERRKQIREAYHQERPWWADDAIMDAEMKRRMSLSDKPRKYDEKSY